MMTIKTNKGAYTWDSEKKRIDCNACGLDINTDISLSALEVELMDAGDSELFCELITVIETRI